MVKNGELGPIRLNRKTMQQALDGGLGIRGVLQQDAARILQDAQARAPVVTGDYQASLRIVEDHTDRMRLRVEATAPHARSVERRHSVLAKAAGASTGRKQRNR